MGEVVNLFYNRSEFDDKRQAAASLMKISNLSACAMGKSAASHEIVDIFAAIGVLTSGNVDLIH